MTLKLFKLLMFLKGKALHIFLCLVLIFAFCFKDSVPSAQALDTQEDSEITDEAGRIEALPDEREAITVFDEEVLLSAGVKKFDMYSSKTTTDEEELKETQEETDLSETETEAEETSPEEKTAPATEETFAEEVTEAEETAPQTTTEEIIVTADPQESSSPSLPINSQYGQRYQEQWEIDYANQLFDLVNSERAKYGVEPLKKMDALTAAAAERAWEVSCYNSHTRPDGTSCFTILTQYGLPLSTRAENIAYYSRTPQAAFNSLMSSYAHRDPMLNSKFEYMGVGFYCVYDDAGGYHYYWTQIFYTP